MQKTISKHEKRDRRQLSPKHPNRRSRFTELDVEPLEDRRMLVTTLIDFDVFAATLPGLSSDGDGTQIAAVASDFGRAHAIGSNNIATTFASSWEGEARASSLSEVTVVEPIGFDVKWKIGGPWHLGGTHYFASFTFQHWRGSELLNWAAADVTAIINTEEDGPTIYQISEGVNEVTPNTYTLVSTQQVIFEGGFGITIQDGDILTYDSSVEVASAGTPFDALWASADVRGFVSPGPPPGDPTAPKVSNIIISSTVPNSYGTNPAYEFDEVVGSKEQLRTVPVGGADRIAIKFTEDVYIGESDLQLIALNRVVAEPSVTDFVAPSSSNGYIATWTLSTPLPAAQYLLRLADTIIDLDGIALDGEWTNPGNISTGASTSSFGSMGNGSPGGDFEFVFTYMPGDANRNLEVSGADLATLSANYNQSNKTWAHGDFTGDGSVTGADLAMLASMSGKNWANLSILGDYDGDFHLDSEDKDDFETYFAAQNTTYADLDKDNDVDEYDYDAFYALFGFGILLDVET